MATVDGLFRTSEIELVSARTKLIHDLRDLAVVLAIEASLMEGDENYRPNSLGVIQGRASRIDGLCVLVDALHRQSEYLSTLVATAQPTTSETS